MEFANTAIVLIDVYNDFLHPTGKMYFATKDDLARKDTIKHLQRLVSFARSKSIPIYYGLHQQIKPGFFDGWKHMSHIHHAIQKTSTFAEGSHGAQIYEGLEPSLENKDVVFSKHWSSRWVFTCREYRHLPHLMVAIVLFIIRTSIISCVNVI
jgi:nicotinamidase-related amidase